MEKCDICGTPMVPDRYENNKWDNYTYKFNCDCLDPNLRVAVG